MHISIYTMSWHFQSRVGRVGVPKILTKDLSHPTPGVSHPVFCCLSPSLRCRRCDDYAPSAGWKKAVHLPFVNCQLCNLFISETSSFEFPFFSAMRLFDFRRLSLHHMWRGVGFTRVHVHVRLQFSILQHIRRHSRMRTCDTFGS